MAGKGIIKPLILAVTSIVTPGQSNTFQLLLDELSVLALKPLRHFKGEKIQLLAALMAKATSLTRRTLIVLVNADSLLNCLILKGARKKYNIIMLKFSPEEKQMTQGVLGQQHSYSIDPGNPERRGTLNSLWQNTLWSGFSWCLSSLLSAS